MIATLKEPLGLPRFTGIDLPGKPSSSFFNWGILFCLFDANPNAALNVTICSCS